MSDELLKIGELANRTGLSVRTLHHYDEIGLLRPSRRSDAGHRLYSAADLARLHQLVSLRQLGLSLEEIGDCLDRRDFSHRQVLALHIERLGERIRQQRRLLERLERIAEQLGSSGTVSVEQLVRWIEETIMFDKYFTPDQLSELEQRREIVGQERIKQVETEWVELIARVRAEMNRGADPASEPVRRLARRWTGLVKEFSGGNLRIEASVAKMYSQEPAARQRFDIDAEMMEYVSRAAAADNE